MKALLLAAGLGTRLRPLTNDIPKCMVPLGGRPLLAHWIELFALHISSEPNISTEQIDGIFVNTHYLSDTVSNYVSSSPFADRITLLHEPDLLGTAGTLRAIQTLLADSPFVMVHADNVSRFNLSEFINQFRQKPDGCIGTMMTFMTATPRECGIVEIDTNGVMVDYFEKVDDPPSNLANAAVFIFEPEIHEILNKLESARDFCADVVPKLRGKLNTFHNKQYHRDIGSPESYRIACKDFEQWTQNASL